MKVIFITNACCIYESNGYKILCDPWLSTTAFYDGWIHDPPIKTKPEDVADYDLLYISHLHPDHFDPWTLSHFDKSKPVLILDRTDQENFLERLLLKEGFKTIVTLINGCFKRFGPFDVYMFEPFTGIPFHSNVLGNPIDSAIVVKEISTDQIVLNANDNTLDVSSAEWLKDKFKEFDLAQLNYNPAGPYPACFENLNHAEKIREGERIKRQYFIHNNELVRILKPKYFMPFAGQFAFKNKKIQKYAGLVSAKEHAKSITDLHGYTKPLVLKEGESFEF